MSFASCYRICASALLDKWPGYVQLQVLLGIQELLKSPNHGDPAQQQAWEDFELNPREYDR